ncbi:hypothetical protein AGLY_013871 [Aphis glycines]|uniref:Uncharacterized protein n=1 Tax=Aphis glycines TaxID=307491 RepID=A0A6G0T5N8_APHGL|nr:hypothetical protein AGLY_013871 [Aphis glycines]
MCADDLPPRHRPCTFCYPLSSCTMYRRRRLIRIVFDPADAIRRLGRNNTTFPGKRVGRSATLVAIVFVVDEERVVVVKVLRPDLAIQRDLSGLRLFLTSALLAGEVVCTTSSPPSQRRSSPMTTTNSSSGASPTPAGDGDSHTNNKKRIDESARIDDSEDRHCWKDLVEAVKHKACKEKHNSDLLDRYLIFTHLSTFFF